VWEEQVVLEDDADVASFWWDERVGGVVEADSTEVYAT
jgi:hypothetical protein